MADANRIAALEQELAGLRDPHPLSEAQIAAIAEVAARRALQIVYAEVGMNVMKKIAWLVGVVVIGLFIWLAGKGTLPRVP